VVDILSRTLRTQATSSGDRLKGGKASNDSTGIEYSFTGLRP
jgi:hypothetical protein